MRHSNVITKHLLASVIGLSMVSLANAASITYPAASSVFAGGTTTFEFSPLAMGHLDTVRQTNQGYGAGTVNTLLDEEGFYLQASFSTPNSSMTLDSDTHQILNVAATGGITSVTPRLRGVAIFDGFSTITHLNVDLVNKKVYADLIGANGLGTLPQVHLWNVANITTAITRVGETDGLPNLDITQTLTGLSLTSDADNAYRQAHALIGIGHVSLQGAATEFGTLTTVNRFNVAPGYFTSAVPEPASWALMGVGLLGIGLTARSRRTCLSAATA